MPAEILTQDIVGILLILSDGDVDLTLGKNIRLAENFQQVHNRHFGISQSDFRNLFCNLFFEEPRFQGYKQDLSGISLGEVIPEILRYQAAYFNDEGEYWITLEELTDQDLALDDDYASEELSIQMELKDQMRRFLENPPNQDAVREYMKEHNVSEKILYLWSRKGESS